MSKGTPLHRKLAAILAADVVGYSALMEADEVGTLRRLQSLQRTCIMPLAATHGGRLIKTTGDGFLFEFSSAVDAVVFAIEMQKQINAAMTDVPDDKRIVMRTGVHAGDIISDGVDMFGDGVNVAARLETLCTPGGLCVSALVRDQLHGKVDLPLVDHGEHQVKNLSRAVHVFQIEADKLSDVATDTHERLGTILKKKRPWIAAAVMALVIATIVATALLRTQILHDSAPVGVSLAVLPFESLDSDSKHSDFADALVHNLTSDLSISIPTLTVISSTSAFTYRNKHVDPRQAGRELGVKYLLEGSVQRAADVLKVNAQLVDTRTGNQLWSDHFDGTVTQLSKLQDQITAAIANTLQLQLIRIEAQQREESKNATALDLVFHGEASMTGTYSAERFDEAGQAFRKALALDPDDLTATIDLAQVLAISGTTSGGMANEKGRAQLEEAEKLLDKARAQNARRVSLHNALGLVYLGQGRVKEAAEQFRLEIGIDRNAASSYANLALCLTFAGKPAEAVPVLERSLRLNPRDPNIWAPYNMLAMAYFALSKYSDAIAAGEKAYAENPRNADVLFLLAASYAQQDALPEARAKVAEGLEVQPSYSITAGEEAIKNGEPFIRGLMAKYFAALRKAGLTK